MGELAARGHTLITGVGIFGEGAGVQLVVRMSDVLDPAEGDQGVAYLLQGSPLEVVPMRSLSIREPEDSAEESIDDGDDDGDGEEEGDEEDDEEASFALWTSLEGEPERQRELVALIDGPTMTPMVATFVLRPARPAAAVADPATPKPAPKRRPSGHPDASSQRLCVIDERSGLLVLEIGLEGYDVPGSRRGIFPVSSGANVLPGTTVSVTSRPPQVSAFRPQRFIIGGNAADWVVRDVQIGGRSQLSQSGDLPGEIFAVTGMDTFISFGVVLAGEGVTFVVSYVGASPEGAPFIGGLAGEIAEGDGFVRVHCLAVRWTPEGRRQGWMIGLAGDDEDADVGMEGASPQDLPSEGEASP